MFLCDKSIHSITEYLTKKGYRNRKGNIFSTKLIGILAYHLFLTIEPALKSDGIVVPGLIGALSGVKTRA